MDEVDIPELVESLGSQDDSIRKRAAFRLQGIIGDPAFADNFETAGGLTKLRALALGATGNTLAYTLASFSRLLELEQGWSSVDQKLIARLVQLVVAHPLVNILRGAMSILALVVAHPGSRSNESAGFGFRALKPSIDVYPNFLEMLVSRLSSADHALCANAIQLINALMRDSITNDAEDEWPKFIKRLQDLGAIAAVYALMQSTGLQDLAQPLLEFQFLTKILLRKWREMAVDQDKKEHRRVLKAIHLASKQDSEKCSEEGKRGNKERDTEKWRKLGFESEMPAREFEEVGVLGMMDLSDFARKGGDSFHSLVLEQNAKFPAKRCPLAKVSLAVTSILYDHFEIDSAENEDHQRYVALESKTNFDKVFKPLLLQWSRLHTSGLHAFLRLWDTTGAEIEDFYKIEELVRILIEHVVGLAPRTEEVARVELDMANYELHRLRELQMELLELTHEDAWGHHLRQIKNDLHHEALQFIREQRTRCLLAGSWFPNITTLTPPHAQPSSPLKSPTSAILRPSIDSQINRNTHTPPWRYVRLSHNRRFLHYADFEDKTVEAPGLDSLTHQVPLTNVVSVVSNVEAGNDARDDADATLLGEEQDAVLGSHKPSIASDRSHMGPKRNFQHPTRVAHTTITLLGHPTPAMLSAQDHQTTARHRTGGNTLSTPGPSPAKSHKHPNNPNANVNHNHPTSPISPPTTTTTNTTNAAPLLTLHLLHPTLASEWLDGLLLLLNQAPITSETLRLVDFIAKYGLKIRLLNVRFEEALVVRMAGVDGAGGAPPGVGGGLNGAPPGVGGGYGQQPGVGGGYLGGEVVLPGREGVDSEFFYDVAGA